MADTPEGALCECLEAGEVALVVGTGVSAATCPNSIVDGHNIATWKGLLEHGIEFAVAWTQASADWAALTSEHVRRGDLETAAHLVVDRLRAPQQSARLMAKWLKCTVGTLCVPTFDPLGSTDQGATLINTLWSLRMPVITTNYDTLIEDAIGVTGVTWREPDRVQAALVDDLTSAAGARRRPVHLHGVHDQAATVILDPHSYGVLSANTGTKVALEATVFNRSLLFVGCGAGVSDPTFRSLRAYLRDKLRWSRRTHFLLARRSDVDGLRDMIADDPIYVIVYGDEHEELEPYVRDQLLPNSAVRR